MACSGGSHAANTASTSSLSLSLSHAPAAEKAGGPLSALALLGPAFACAPPAALLAAAGAITVLAGVAVARGVVVLVERGRRGGQRRPRLSGTWREREQGLSVCCFPPTEQQQRGQFHPMLLGQPRGAPGRIPAAAPAAGGKGGRRKGGEAGHREHGQGKAGGGAGAPTSSSELS